MATKVKSRKAARGSKSKPQDGVLEAVNQIWLAGLGAISKAREGTPQMLSALVAEGARVQAETRGTAEKAIGGFVGNMKATLDSSVQQVRGQAGDALDNLEQIFQTRVRRALTQLGVPSAEDIERLSKRVEALNASVGKLSQAQKAPVRHRHIGRKSGSAHAAMS